MKMMNEPNCGGVTIRSYAKEIGVLGIVFTVLTIVAALCTENFWFLLLIILFLPNYAIIYYVTKDKCCAYLPYLILHGILLLYSICLIFGILICLLLGIPILVTDKRDDNDASAELIVYILIGLIIILAVYILYIYFYVVIYRAYKFTKNFIEPSRNSLVQKQMNSTTSKTLPIQHPGVINGNTCPSYNDYAYSGQGHPYPQQIDIPIGFVNSYTECLEKPPCYQLHDPATNNPTHHAPNAQKDIVTP